MTDKIWDVDHSGHKHLTPEEIKRGCMEIEGEDGDAVKTCRISEELEQGLTEMELHRNSVTFYGSARFKEGDEFYEKARNLGARISKELGLAIVTGGGPGIMEAGNRGAFEAGGKSVGVSIELPREQHNNPYTTDSIPFYYFFTRKLTLRYSSEVYIFFPGGFGTFDESFEVITLIQTGKLKRVPIIMYGTEFWGPFMKNIKDIMLDKYHTISEDDMNLFTVTDDDNLVLDIIKQAKPITDTAED